MNVIVTGASRGIGRGIAEVLAADGHAVGLLARNREPMERVQRQIENDGGRAATATGDLADFDATQQAIGSLIEQLGGVDALVNNAGVVTREATADIPVDKWHEMIAVNLHGPFHATRAVLPTLRDQQRGHIVNISSIAGITPLPGGSGYAASKHGLTGFSDSLVQELRDENIRVTTILPGSTASSDEPAEGEAWKVRPSDIGRTVSHVLSMREGALISRVEMRPLHRRPHVG